MPDSNVSHHRRLCARWPIRKPLIHRFNMAYF
jgi:hypothetical protein